LRGVGLMRQLGTLGLAIRGEPATREHVRHILATTLDATRAALRRKWQSRVALPPAAAATVPRAAPGPLQAPLLGALGSDPTGRGPGEPLGRGPGVASLVVERDTHDAEVAGGEQSAAVVGEVYTP